MPRDRNPRRASPDSSLGDYTPDSRSPVRSYSPSRSRSRSRSRRERRGSEYETPVRSRSQSRRRGRRDSSASSDSSVRSGASRGHGGKARLASKLKDKTTTTSGLKTSLVFLGSIAAATYAAHKFWPKGITYGEREAWEEEHEAVKKKAKRAVERGEDPRSHHGPGPSRHGPPVDDGDGGGDRRRPIAYDRPRSSLARYETDEVALRRRDNDNRLAVRDDAPFVRRAASLHRGHSDGVTTMSVASGSRAGDARRAQYVDENQTVRRDDQRAYAAWDRRDEGLDEDRRYADYGRPAPRYVEREVPRRRSSFDEPPDGRRGERVVYM